LNSRKTLLSRVVERISDHPVLFIFFRSLLENDFKAIRQVIRRELPTGTGLRTLDLGCGPGAFADLFAGDDYVGADLNARYVDHARHHRPGTFIVSDARKLDLPDRRFDQILIFGLLHHLPDDDVRAVLREARRVLVPGGRVLVIEDIPAVSRLNLIGHLIHNVENGEHIRPVDDYRKLYSEAARIDRDDVLRSGICDYYSAVLVTDPAGAPAK
jgi:SAM-dependent methyltransferase